MTSNVLSLPTFYSRAATEESRPDGWDSIQVDDAIEHVKQGPRFDQKSVADAGQVPVLDQSADGVIGFHDGTAGVEASKGLPVVTFANHTCNLRFMTGSFSTIQNVFAFRGRAGLSDTRFLYYWLQGRISTDEYKGFFPTLRAQWLHIPPLDEQRRIAGVLGALDDLIEVNRGLMRDLDDLGMALFRSSWDGESWTPISSLGSVIMGQSPPGSTYNEQGLGTVFFQGVRDFGDRYPRSRVHCTAPTRVADPGDILIAVRAPIGETNVAVERTAIGRGLAALKASQPAVSLRAVRASERTWAAHQGTGTVFSSISGPDLKTAEVPSVDDPVLEATLATLDSMHLALSQEIDELSATRDELLPLLMSGRVRVAEEVAA